MRKSVILSLYRPLDIRLMVATGIVERIAEAADIILLVPKVYLTELRQRVSGAVRVEALRFPTSKVRSDDLYAGFTGGWRGYLRDRLAAIAELTYGNRGGTNESGVLVRAEYLRRANRPHMLAVWAIASLACRSRALRRLLQQMWLWTCPFRPHADLYSETQPVLLVTASAGLGVDGMVMAEAAAQGCPTAVVVQSWDKTSTKGYPPVAPAHMLVWSDRTAEEAVAYLDMRPDQVHIVGAPVWDHYFRDTGIERAQFLQEFDLAADTRSVVYVSIGYPAHHEGNLAITETLLDALTRGDLPAGTALLFRLHPVYFEFEAERRDLMRVFERYLPSDRWHVDIPSGGGNSYFLDDKDGQKLANIFRHSTICVQASSTQMIEAAIFDCMVIDVAFGRWRNKYFDLDISDLDLTHLHRVRSADAANRVNSRQNLVDTLADLVRREDDGRRDRRRALVAQELSVNRGDAAKAMADKLVELIHAG